MSTLKPGFYKATVRGVPDVVLVVGEEPIARGGGWTAALIAGCHWHQSTSITDARPLIVLDMTPDALNFISTLVLGGSEHSWSKEARRQIEAQTKPPRIPEPGQWGVVQARVGGATYLFVNWGSDWFCSDLTHPYDWDELIDPVLIREGVA